MVNGVDGTHKPFIDSNIFFVFRRKCFQDRLILQPVREQWTWTADNEPNTSERWKKISDVEYADDNVADKIFNTRLRLLFLFITIFIQI